jgi:hypothetical protein
MDNSAQILRLLPLAAKAPSTTNHFKGAAPFKVQVNFDIHLLEGHIDVYGLKKWLNIYRVIIMFKKKLTSKKSPCSLNPFPVSNIARKVTGREKMKMSL